jgi:phosphatidylglycerol lysyltransferase
MGLLEDKSYFFSPGGSVVNYVVEGHIAVTLGDPIGPAGDLPDAIRAFQAYCSQNDWLAAFYQVLPDGLVLYREAGFDVLGVGNEGIVDLAAFTMEGGENKGIRSAYNRLTRKGYRAEVSTPPIEERLIAELRQISDEWLTNMHGSEKRFSLGWFDDAYIRNGLVMVIYNQENFPVAFANILPEFQRNESTIDLMRHRKEVENGIMDYLFVSLFQWAREQGYDSFNLGLSSLSGVGEKLQDPAIERALHYIYEHVNQFYNFKGLHEFKEKFHPEWSPRYLVYPGIASLPQVTMALIQADSGGNLISSYLAHAR